MRGAFLRFKRDLRKTKNGTSSQHPSIKSEVALSWPSSFPFDHLTHSRAPSVTPHRQTVSQATIRTARASAMRPRAALATALLVVLATATPAAWAVKSKGDCTDATFANAYSGIREQMDACEEASGQVMQVPMKKKLKVIFCTKCPELLALKNSGTLPACNVTTTTGAEIHLQSAFNRMFSECDGGTATSNSDGSDDDGGSTEPTTTTSAPSATTKTPVTTKPPAATDTGSKSSSSPSQSSASTSGDTAAVSSSTPKPLPTDSSTTSQTASASGGTHCFLS